MSQGLARVEELFEARSPKNAAAIAELDGILTTTQTDKGIVVRITAQELYEEEYLFQEDYAVQLKEGQEVKDRQVIAKSTKDKGKIVTLHS
jgi:DNA-directed RNA polymerase subunit beta'